MFYDDLAGLVRVLVVGALAYVWLIAVLRVTGKRTLAQLNAFGFIVTVALGSTLATVALSSTVAWTEGALALAVLAALQYAAAWVSLRVTWMRSTLTSDPTLLVRDGRVLEAALQSERITRQSLHHAVRSAGIGGLDRVGAVVLETNGTLSVVGLDAIGDKSALAELSPPSRSGRKDDVVS